MPENKKKSKTPSKRHQPRGLSILFEDRDIIVVDKRNGLLTVGTEKERDKTAHALLNQYVKKGNNKSRNRVFIVHRLDKDTSGVLVFAKSEQVKRTLQEQWKEFSKKYYVVVKGTMKEKEGVISSYLAENKVHRMYSTDDPSKGKFSKTGYKVLKESKKFSLLEVELHTGRKNQIRVHLAEQGNPVAGDIKYGSKEKGVNRLTLHSASLTLIHPHSKKEMTFETKIPAYFESLMKK